jgi:hypothetical protein
MGWESVADYKPESGNDFGIIKSKNLECSVQYARIEVYKGQRPELQGVKFFKYELSVSGGDEAFIGRKLWGSFNLEKEAHLKKLKNLFFISCAVDLKNESDLETNLEKFCGNTYAVEAWGWKPENSEESIQQHNIKKVKPVEFNDKPSF